MSSPAGVVAIAGLPGAGKTTLATALAEQTGWRVVSRDRVRLALFESCTFTQVEKDAAFAAVCVAIQANLILGATTIVEGMPFSREGELERVRSIAEADDGHFAAYFMDLPATLAAERVERDRTLRPLEVAPDRTPSLVQEVARRMRVYPNFVTVLDAKRPTPALATLVLDDLQRRGFQCAAAARGIGSSP